jgi:hypothetical protein
MTQFEIYWNDLTDEAKNRLSDLYHDNIHLTPLTTIEVEKTEQLTQKEKFIEYIKEVINEWGAVTSGELQLESDPIVNSMNDGETVELIERFDSDSVSTTIYANDIETNGQDLEYEELDFELISEIYDIISGYEIDMQKTMDRTSGYDF